MAPRRRARRGRRQRSGRVLNYQFSYVMNVTPGAPTTKDFSFGSFAIDASRPVKIVSVTASISVADGGVTTASLALFGPPTGTNTGSIVARSAIRTFAAAPRSVTVRAPPGTDHFTPGSNNLLFQITSWASQPHKGDTTVHIILSGSARLRESPQDVPVLLK